MSFVVTQTSFANRVYCKMKACVSLPGHVSDVPLRLVLEQGHNADVWRIDADQVSVGSHREFGGLWMPSKSSHVATPPETESWKNHSTSCRACQPTEPMTNK